MTVLCHIDDIGEGKTRGFEAGELNIIALKKAGEVYLYINSCPHLGVNLEFQPDDFLNYDETHLQCAMHGALFTLETGLCIAGPCQDQALTPVDYTLQDGLIVLTESGVATQASA